MVSIHKIPKIFELMNRFQEENNITGACVSNCQYLYDTLKKVYNVKVQAVIVSNLKTKVVCSGHVVLVIDNDILIDPSYQYNSINGEDLVYYPSWKHFNEIAVLMTNVQKKQSLKDWIYFQKIADRINAGELVVHHDDNYKDVYHKQADYIEKYLLKNKNK